MRHILLFVNTPSHHWIPYSVASLAPYGKVWVVSQDGIAVTGPGVDYISVNVDETYTCPDMLALNLLLDIGKAITDDDPDAEILVLPQPTWAFTDPFESANLPTGRGNMNCAPCVKSPTGLNLVNTLKLLKSEGKQIWDYSRSPWTYRYTELQQLFPERFKSLNVPTYVVNSRAPEVKELLGEHTLRLETYVSLLTNHRLTAELEGKKLLIAMWRFWSPVVQEWMGVRFPNHSDYTVTQLTTPATT